MGTRARRKWNSGMSAAVQKDPNTSSASSPFTHFQSVLTRNITINHNVCLKAHNWGSLLKLQLRNNSLHKDLCTTMHVLILTLHYTPCMDLLTALSLPKHKHLRSSDSQRSPIRAGIWEHIGLLQDPTIFPAIHTIQHRHVTVIEELFYSHVNET